MRTVIHSSEEQQLLDDVVGAALTDVVQFDARGRSVRKARYFTLMPQGRVLEKAEVLKRSWPLHEAISLYVGHLRDFISANVGRQIAWKARPEIVRYPDGCKIYSRLAFVEPS